MLENIKATYSQYRWAKLATCLLLAGAGYLLFQIAGGFPPWAWRFLFNVVPRLPALWAAQGAGMLLPFFGLLLLSIALLILWAIIVLGISQSIVLLWHDPEQEEQAQYDFDEDASPDAMTQAYPTTQSADYDDYDTVNYMDATSRPSNTIIRRGAALRPSAFNDQHDAADADWEATSEDAIPTQPARTQASRLSRPHIPPVPIEDLPIYTRPTRPERAVSTRTRSRPHIPPIPANQPAYEEQQLQSALQARQFQQHSAQQVQSLRGAVPTYDPLPGSTWSSAHNAHVAPSAPNTPGSPSNAQPGAHPTGTLHKHLRLVSERTTPDSHFSEDDEVFMEELNEELDTDGLEQTQYPRATRPIVVEDDRTQPTRTGWDEDDDEQEAPLRLVVGIGLDPGLLRKDRPNEDSLFAIQGLRSTSEGSVPAGLFVIADGMGGHANGRDASRLATRSVSDVIVPALLRDDSDDDQDEKAEHELLLDLLKDGVHRANLAIYQRNRNVQQMMGTTVTTALVVDTTAYVVNVGDSRTYLYRPADGLMPITRDHSTVARLVEKGEIKRDDIYTHPQRNQIYRCLGEHPTVEMDTFVVHLQPDDILLLCSDGLWEMVRDPAMEKIIASSSHLPTQISTILVQAALSQGGADNISVIVVGVVKSTL